MTAGSRFDKPPNKPMTVIEDAPELSGTDELFLEEESDMTLSCDSRANPPVTMVWHRDGQALDLSVGRYVATDDGVTARLSATTLKRELHEGLYSCTASSPVEGTTTTKSFQVTVTDKVMKFPRDAMIAGIVVVVCTAMLALLSRWDRIFK
ncbi:transmembrane and immunoglobulin domain-containing protein 1-like, partial [Engraulis encrasicolus]|uniref:transmembrane and immunoglobulin domain-containing protein 1-like n=1 Tax=Engraulis encrasicolus TaxID=184585 RepID=UPI002FD2238A